MGALWSLIAVAMLIFCAYLGVTAGGLEQLFGIVLPYIAIAVFFIGMVCRVLDWARSAVPFSIPTTCGQQKSLDFIKPNPVDNPQSKGAVVFRMIFEVLTFRSLFRNTKMYYDSDGPSVYYASEKVLWLAAIAFHYSFLVVLLWHLRFFIEPVPFLVTAIEGLDGFLEVGLPGLLISGVVLVAAVGYLLQRRVINPQVRYISLFSDYFPLWLILAIGVTGILMRYFIRVDVVTIREFTVGLASFNPQIPQGYISPLFFIHVFLVSVLFIYFPFSKLVHLGGIFLSPTRVLPANSREVRHVNPWDYPVKVHTYQEYENENRELMEEVGLAVERPSPPKPPEEEAPTEA